MGRELMEVLRLNVDRMRRERMGVGRRRKGKPVIPRLAALLAVAFLSACGGGGGGGGTSTSAELQGCSVAEQNQFVYDAMQDIYYWVEDMPEIEPADFASPEAVLDALRVPQDRFSFLTTQAADDAFFGDGQFAGMGLRSDQPEPGALRIVEVFEGSPADRAGLRRGDRVLSVNGRPIEDVLAEEGFSRAVGPNEVGVEVDLTWRRTDGTEQAATIVKAVVTIPPVAAVNVLDTAAGPVGYLELRTFVDPAAEPLADAFGTFKAAGVEQVVIDLRYNTGGLLTIARVLADLAGGAGAAGQPFYTQKYNAANSFRNNTAAFRNRANSLAPARLLFIVTSTSASASEMVINGLEPFYDVVLVGEQTRGKPVGQNAIRFCDQLLRPVSFAIVNALGEGDYFDGLPVDCAAVDDIDTPLGDPSEASLAEALHYAENGACSTPAATDPAIRAKPTRSTQPWRLLDAD
jgi:hypothetical protein